MLKNLVCWEIEKNGFSTFLIASNDYSLDDFYNDWAFSIAQKYEFNTVETYSRSVAHFLDYILEIGNINNGLSPALLNQAIDAYQSYLLFASDSDNSLAKKAAINLSATTKSSSTLTPTFAAVNNFIEASESFRRSVLQLESQGYIDPGMASETPLFEVGHREINHNIARGIKANSWLAGCISGGAKKLKKRRLVSKSQDTAPIYSDIHGGDEKTFPYDRAKELIFSAKTYRDKALWSLIAATGCRISEALTVTWDDILLEDRRVMIIPAQLRRTLLLRYFSEAELRKITHKGRTTSETYMIRPYDQLFWKFLDLYMSNEYKRGVSHRFVFQKQNVNGDPYVRSYRAALQIFHKATLKVTGELYGFHSLRHMYGYYLKNWCPNGNGGWGLPVDEVMLYMGHKNINTTKKYARDDVMKLQATISYANVLQDQGRFTSVVDSKIKLLQEQIEKLEAVSSSKRLEDHSDD